MKKIYLKYEPNPEVNNIILRTNEQLRGSLLKLSQPNLLLLQKGHTKLETWNLKSLKLETVCSFRNRTANEEVITVNLNDFDYSSKRFLFWATQRIKDSSANHIYYPLIFEKESEQLIFYSSKNENIPKSYLLDTDSNSICNSFGDIWSIENINSNKQQIKLDWIFKDHLDKIFGVSLTRKHSKAVFLDGLKFYDISHSILLWEFIYENESVQLNLEDCEDEEDLEDWEIVHNNSNNTLIVRLGANLLVHDLTTGHLIGGVKLSKNKSVRLNNVYLNKSLHKLILFWDDMLVEILRIESIVYEADIDYVIEYNRNLVKNDVTQSKDTSKIASCENNDINEKSTINHKIESMNPSSMEDTDFNFECNKVSNAENQDITLIDKQNSNKDDGLVSSNESILNYKNLDIHLDAIFSIFLTFFYSGTQAVTYEAKANAFHNFLLNTGNQSAFLQHLSKKAISDWDKINERIFCETDFEFYNPWNETIVKSLKHIRSENNGEIHLYQRFLLSLSEVLLNIGAKKSILGKIKFNDWDLANKKELENIINSN